MQKKQSFSTEYRNQAIRALFAILLFIFVYLTVLALSIILIGFLFYEAFNLHPNSLLKFFLSIGLFVTAFILLIFVIFFFFRKSTVDRSGWIETNKEEQPKLFDLIERHVNKASLNSVETSIKPNKAYSEKIFKK